MNNQYLLSDEEDPNLMGDLTPGTSQAMAPPPSSPIPVASPPMAPLSLMSTMPHPQIPTAAPMARTPQLPGMPPTMNPSDIASYLGKQGQSLEKFGPDKQMALQQQLNARKDSLGYKSGDALSGFADALMQGVSRAGNSNFKGQYETQENQYAQDQMNTLRGANEAQGKNTEAKMTLDKMNPNSVLSKTAQGTYAPLFQELGYPPGKLNGMSAANIDNALQLMAVYGGKEIEAKIKKYELDIERTRTEAALANTQSETSHRKDQERFERDKLKAEHPFLSMTGGLDGEESFGGVPSVGGTFNGEKVMRVTRVK